LTFVTEYGGQVRCPVTGCSQIVKRDDVKVDKKRTREIKRRVREIEAQERAAEEDIIGF
jgi:hypothetical protein